MTREEAIKIINCYDIGFYDLSGEKIPADKLAEAFHMAIEALQAEPAKHGKWINKRLTKDSIKDIKDGTYGELIGYHDICSICGFDLDKYWHGYKPPYCPNCGAKMDKE